MKITLIILAAIVAVILLVAIVGSLLPRAHEATRSARFRKSSPRELYATVRDFAAQPSWRSGLKSVELLPARDGQMRYREQSRHGAINYVVLEDVPGEKLVVKIADENLPYGGTWTFEFSELATEAGGVATGARVRITERGEVKNVIFRALARFVFGYSSTIEAFLRDLGKKVGETVDVEE
jgi:hypothetical protein